MLEILRDENGAEDGPEIVPLEHRIVETDVGAVDALAETGRDGFWLLGGPVARAPDLP